ncbi:MAG: hypothetical protein HY878_05385, partial [Deltaproteobacteria bacterium]|nr:hypothetical protein [Deltaproteobacteria bacterium]
MAQYELNIRDYWRIVRKRKNIIILTTLLLTSLTFALSLIRRPEAVYEATASVKVDRATSMAGLFLEVITFSPGDTLATQTVIIRSFPVLERVAKTLGTIPRGKAPDYSRIITQLQSKIKTEQEGNTNIINITVTSSDPDEAQRIANTVAQEFREYSILERNKQVMEARRFIERQLKLVEERLKEAEEALNRFREKKGVVSITEEQGNLLKRYSEIEAQRDKIDAGRKGIRAELALIEKGKGLSGETLERFATGEESPAILRLNAKLSDLLLERQNLLINYLPAHPKVKEMDKQIANITGEMKKELLSRAKALEREGTIIEEGLRGLRGKVALLPETALELTRLERDVKINEDL